MMLLASCRGALVAFGQTMPLPSRVQQIGVVLRLDIHFGTSNRDDPHDAHRIAIEAAMSVKRLLTHRPAVGFPASPAVAAAGSGESSAK